MNKEISWAEEITLLMKECEVYDEDVSEMFDCSRPSIKRWREGKSEPTPVLKEIIRKELKKYKHNVID